MSSVVDPERSARIRNFQHDPEKIIPDPDSSEFKMNLKLKLFELAAKIDYFSTNA
jgi:hypothetical protein